MIANAHKGISTAVIVTVYIEIFTWRKFLPILPPALIGKNAI
jgi:hypothetical protein